MSLSVGTSDERTGPPEAAPSALPLEAAAEAPADAPAAPPPPTPAAAAEPPASVAAALGPLGKKSSDAMPTAAPTSLLKRTRGSDAFRRRAFFAADSSDDLRADCVTEQRGAISIRNWNDPEDKLYGNWLQAVLYVRIVYKTYSYEYIHVPYY